MKRLALAATGLVALVVILTLAVAAAPSPRAGIKYLNAPGWSDALPFSHAVDTGDTVYLSGGIGIDPETGRAPDDLGKEIHLLMDDMKGKLALAGLTMDDLVTVQIFCSDLALYDQFNDIYRTYFKKNFPARAFIGSGPILRGGRFEIQGIARRR